MAARPRNHGGGRRGLPPVPFGDKPPAARCSIKGVATDSGQANFMSCRRPALSRGSRLRTQARAASDKEAAAMPRHWHRRRYTEFHTTLYCARYSLPAVAGPEHSAPADDAPDACVANTPALASLAETGATPFATGEFDGRLNTSDCYKGSKTRCCALISAMLVFDRSLFSGRSAASPPDICLPRKSAQATRERRRDTWMLRQTPKRRTPGGDDMHEPKQKKNTNLMNGRNNQKQTE